MDTRQPLDARASLLMLSLCLLWSLQQISLKAVAGQASPMLMVGLRSAVAALLLVGWMRLRGERVVLQRAHWGPGLVVGALFALEYLLVAAALQLTHASHVVVFLYTAPLFAALGLQWRLPSERLDALQWTGISVAFAGIAIAFLSRGPGAQALGGPVLLGDLLALLAGASWGATTVTIRCTTLSTAPAAETLLYQLLCAFALLVPAAWLTGQSHFALNAHTLGHFAFQAVVVSFASFLVWFWLLRHYLASRLGVFSFLTPVFGVLLGIWLLGEPLEASFLAGSALVLLGIFMVSAGGWLRPWWGRLRGRPHAVPR
ncbi:DMT family transporter [Hydrogenophaga sp. NFH-34]|uniref:DMT family transporter n=1 Tax=Hydrogenophaga sp. NFH-34 TaxID=2744446 RepID=UPI001F35812D|nr:DMT family transporter [Hydrogenophaga sp. NFH-34]